jgi:hypothetical protein
VLKAADLAPCRPTTACKICGGIAPLYGVADFNKSCEELRGRYLPLLGIPVYYHRCESCGLVFTEALDAWQKADYRKHIYNDRYIEVDPDYAEARPREYAGIVRAFLQGRPSVRHFDYGGGNGRLAALLRAEGVDASTWDPMVEGEQPPAGRFDLVTAFEVFEHTPVPNGTLQEMLGFCDAATPLIFFSTYTIDKVRSRSMDFWYLSPRNGHVTIHTESSLRALATRADLRMHHFGNGFHLAYRSLPSWVDLELFEKLHRQGGIRGAIARLIRALRSARA